MPSPTSPRPDKDVSSSHRNSISLTRLFSPSPCVLLSFLIENFYPHSLTLQKRASFASWAVPDLSLQVCRARFTSQPLPHGGWLGAPHDNEPGCLNQSRML